MSPSKEYLKRVEEEKQTGSIKLYVNLLLGGLIVYVLFFMSKGF